MSDKEKAPLGAGPNADGLSVWLSELEVNPETMGDVLDRIDTECCALARDLGFAEDFSRLCVGEVSCDGLVYLVQTGEVVTGNASCIGRFVTRYNPDAYRRIAQAAKNSVIAAIDVYRQGLVGHSLMNP